jgi:hypothetical protein
LNFSNYSRACLFTDGLTDPSDFKKSKSDNIKDNIQKNNEFIPANKIGRTLSFFISGLYIFTIISLTGVRALSLHKFTISAFENTDKKNLNN